MCCPILVSDPALLEKHAKAWGLPSKFRVIDRMDGPEFETQEIVVLDPQVAGAADMALGEVSASSGRAHSPSRAPRSKRRWPGRWAR
jgi:hypothetical protein